MSVKVSDEMVEAGARAYCLERNRHMSQGPCLCDDVSQCWDWNSATYSQNAMRAALTAALAVQWTVPREPTDAMRARGAEIIEIARDLGAELEDAAGETWRQMYDVALESDNG